MLNINTILASANPQFSADVDAWGEKEVFGLSTYKKSTQVVYAEFLLLTALNNPYITTAQQQEVLGKLLTIKNA